MRHRDIFRSLMHIRKILQFAVTVATVFTQIFIAVGIATTLSLGSANAQTVKPVAERLAALNALFDEQYESDLKNFPERATAFGDYRYNDQLADVSLAAIAQRNQTNQTFLVKFKAI